MKRSAELCCGKPQFSHRRQKCFNLAAIIGVSRGKCHVYHGKCNICDIQEIILHNQLAPSYLQRKVVFSFVLFTSGRKNTKAIEERVVIAFVFTLGGKITAAEWMDMN